MLHTLSSPKIRSATITQDHLSSWINNKVSIKMWLTHKAFINIIIACSMHHALHHSTFQYSVTCIYALITLVYIVTKINYVACLTMFHNT